MGYSDITALTNAIYFNSGLITFYGPMGIDDWDLYNKEYVQELLFNGTNILYSNPKNFTSYNVTTIHGGKARGKLIGGNLSVFITLVDSPFIPSNIAWKDYILFLEDTEEAPYRIDRMLVDLNFTGMLSEVAGVVWGTCYNCTASNVNQSFTIDEVLEFHFTPLNVPCFTGSMIGHIGQQFTLPIGSEVEIDAGEGTIHIIDTPVL